MTCCNFSLFSLSSLPAQLTLSLFFSFSLRSVLAFSLLILSSLSSQILSVLIIHISLFLFSFTLSVLALFFFSIHSALILCVFVSLTHSLTLSVPLSLGLLVIGATIISRPYAGAKHFILRIPIHPRNLDVPFKLRRLQFPIRPAFALTINKSQGQTLEIAGLLLISPNFTNGQLYVALSRTTKRDNLFVLIENEDGRDPS